MNILALDLSLAATGIAAARDGILAKAWTHKPKGEGLKRLRAIRSELRAGAHQLNAEVIVMEGPSFNSKGGYQHERAGLWWLVYDDMEHYGYRIAVIPPKSLKLYAAGKGNASKEDVLVAAVRRLAAFEGDNNAADAAWMAAMAVDHYGFPLWADVPAKNRTALDGVVWP